MDDNENEFIISKPRNGASPDQQSTAAAAADESTLIKDDSAKQVPPPMNPMQRKSKAKKAAPRKLRFAWISLVNMLTCCLPTRLLSFLFKGNLASVVAFREKLVLNFFIAALSFLFFFLVIGLGWIVCPQAGGKVLNDYEVQALTSSSYPLVSAYGSFYLIKDVYKDHVVQAGYLQSGAWNAVVNGFDVSSMFVKVDSFQQYCPGLPAPPAGWDNIKRIIPEKAMTVWTIHNGKTSSNQPKNYLKMIDHDKKGSMARDTNWVTQFLLADPLSNNVVVAYGRVYDVSQYLVSISGNGPTFLGPNIMQIIKQAGKTGQDLTAQLDQVKSKEGVAKWRAYMNCMDSMFFVGVVDQRGSLGCVVSSYIVLVASILIVAVIGVKFLAALQFQPTPSPTPPRRYVLISVPCYNESFDSLMNTFSSVAATKYDAALKVLFVVVDGVVKGRENDQFTSDIVLQVLGHPSTHVKKGGSQSQSDTMSRATEARVPAAPTRLYYSLGDGLLQANMAKVYSGNFSAGGGSMPYIVVVKTGEGSNNGNRGKRDSQLLVLSFLSRLHLEKDLYPLGLLLHDDNLQVDLELQYHFLYGFGIDANAFEFLLWVDGDTELEPDSLALFVSSMENDSLISGICGETVLRNPSQSWVTMIQVYEYWITHNLAKSFESLFGSVTCLPGCFSMFRLFSSSDGTLVVISERVIDEFGLRKVDTLHLKNLLSLGEDRYLTTLCLKNFPQMRTKFISSAIAKTSAPDLWKVLLSQRRRWINSTVHNLLELACLSELKGFFVFSIRFIVLMDLISTLLSPAGFVYFVYLLVVLFSQVVIQLPLVSVLLLCAIYGGLCRLQILLFLIKRQFAHIGWMFLYLLAMPLFTTILPLYSFWKMDDFSWGSTRLVQDDLEGDDQTFGSHVVAEEDVFDVTTSIPRKAWRDFEADGSLAIRLALDLEPTS